MTEQIDWWAKQPSQVACVSEDLKCWGAWDATRVSRHHTIDRLEERCVERGIVRQSSLKGRQRTIVHQTNIRTASMATLVKHLRDCVERICYGLFRVHRSIPSLYELNFLIRAKNKQIKKTVISAFFPWLTKKNQLIKNKQTNKQEKKKKTEVSEFLLPAFWTKRLSAREKETVSLFHP